MKIKKSLIVSGVIAATITPSLVMASEKSINEDISSEQIIDSQSYVKERGISEKENVRKRFKQFYIYGSMSSPTIDLSKKSSVIKKYSQANDLLLTTKDGKKTDRQLFLDAWKKLTSKEKSSKEMADIQKSYKDMIIVVTGAKSTLKFYENVKANRESLIENPSKAIKLNDKSNKSLGARGKAYDDYTKASKIESKSGSKRISYMNEKYVDAVYFLNVSKYIKDKNKDKALKEISKIKDKELKATAERAVNESFFNSKQEDVLKRFEQFYIYGDIKNPTIDLTNKDSLIKTYNQADSMLKTEEDGVVSDRQRFINSYNELSESEKNHPKIVEVKSKYDNMIVVLEAAKSTLKFYEDVKANSDKLILDASKSNVLNSKNNLELGARGRAYEDYMRASKMEPAKSSKRIAHLNQKYCDALYFLNVPKYIKSGDTEKALEYSNKITDSSLKKVAIDAVYNTMGNEFEISPDSPTYKNNYMSRPSYNENTKHYYLIRSYLEELDARGGGTLILKKGTYNLTNTLSIPSNTTIVFDGAILKKTDYTGVDSLTPSRSLFQFISPSNLEKGVKFGEYNGEKNIKLIGKNNATLDLSYMKDSLALIVGHSNNVEISGLKFINMNGGHFIELDASKDVVIKNNEFRGSVAYGNLTKEAINLDTPDKVTQGWDSSWTKYDKTPNLNVLIENNVFSNLDRAIGTHKYSEGKYHTNVKVLNNVIDGTRSDCIRVMNWKNAIIENNVIKNINSEVANLRGILVSGAINPTIKGNTFKNMPRAMQFFPTRNNGGGSEYAITYNELSAQNKADLGNNKIENVGEDFIRINEEYEIFSYPEKIYFY